MFHNSNVNSTRIMKELKKSILTKSDYHLNVDLNCVRLSETVDLALYEISLVTNITTNDVIYNPHCDGMGGIVSGDQVIFEKAFTSEMTDADELMFIVQRNVHLEGINLDSSKVIEENSHLMKDVLVELKITNKILMETFEVEITERDLKYEL